MQSSRSFFDPTLVETWEAAFTREDKLDATLRRLIPNAHLSRGRYSCPGWAEPRDLIWNHMDQNHRPLIHRTYDDAMRVFIGKPAAFSLTRFGRWPAVIPVFDGRHKPNGFYQIICLFGLFVVVNTIECNNTADGTRMDIGWTIASHRLLRFLHPLLDRRLHRLNVVQNAEDDVIRHRRVALRAVGYTFGTDEPDFVKANAMGNNVVYPPLAAPKAFGVADLIDGEISRFELADRSYLARRAGDGLEVWPGVCPHEGAALAKGDVAGNRVKCPWHGLEFGPRRLRPGDPPIELCGASLILANGKLEVVASRKDGA